MPVLSGGEDDKVTFRAGLCYGTACAPADMPLDEVEKRVRAIDVAGTRAGWRLYDSATFRDGTPNPCPCEKDPTRRHILFAC
jgi:hypothetical protein